MTSSDNLAEEDAVVQPVDTRNIRYIRNVDRIFEAAIAQATNMSEGVAMVLADHEGTPVRIETTPGGSMFSNFAAGKIRALLHNDLDNTQLCQRTLCAPGAMAAYLVTGRAGVQGAVMFKYYHPEDGEVTGFFSVSGCSDMWNDVLIAKHGLEGAGYSLVLGETDLYGFGMFHEANQVANAGGFQGSLLERMSEEQPVDTRNIQYIRNVDQIFEAAIAQATNMSEGVTFLLADHNGTTMRTEFTPGGSWFQGVAGGKVQALLHNGLDNSLNCQTTLCLAGAMVSYAFTGRAAIQGAVMFRYFHPTDGLVTGFFSVSGCPDQWDDKLIAKTGLEGAGYSLVSGETDVYAFGLALVGHEVSEGFQGSR